MDTEKDTLFIFLLRGRGFDKLQTALKYGEVEGRALIFSCKTPNYK